MEISKSLNEQLKKRLTNCHSILDVKHIEDDLYSVEFISITEYYNTTAPKFDAHTTKIRLKSEMRDHRIDDILNFDLTLDDFDVEDIIYTDEQREKLERLRTQSNKISRWTALNNVKKEYSENFEIGQRVWYKNAPGIITFKHSDKSEEQITRWSIKVNDTEFRYVDGTDILKREAPRDLSHVKIDPELNRLPTDKLLKMYKSKRNRNKGVGNIAIKRILQDREHIQSGDTKIVVVKK